ncbi:hypothetical protein MP228_008828 [Amoeboaphelidium protococcarum]|nr:hypothetical protein MP228_008828 [Amoeboaphelidium protococcarum]
MMMVSGQSSGSLLVKNAAPPLWSMMSSWCLIAVLFAATLMVIVSNPVHATLTFQEYCDDKVLAVSPIHNRLQLFYYTKAVVEAGSMVFALFFMNDIAT